MHIRKLKNILKFEGKVLKDKSNVMTSPKREIRRQSMPLAAMGLRISRIASRGRGVINSGDEEPQETSKRTRSSINEKSQKGISGPAAPKLKLTRMSRNDASIANSKMCR